MSGSPVQAFADLKGALTRMVALNNAMDDDKAGEDINLVTQWDKQADLAMAAFSELVIQVDAMADIEALLMATYGGEAS